MLYYNRDPLLSKNITFDNLPIEIYGEEMPPTHTVVEIMTPGVGGRNLLGLAINEQDRIFTMPWTETITDNANVHIVTFRRIYLYIYDNRRSKPMIINFLGETIALDNALLSLE